MSTKADVRLAIKERLSRLSERDRTIESRVLCKELSKLFTPQPAVVAAFMPYGDEPDIGLLLSTVLASDVRLVLPAVENNKLVFRRVTDLTSMKRHPVMDILEPSPDCERMDDALIDFAIIPGRAFTRSGDRLGRGNGGYDHWIAAQRTRNEKTRYIGVCYECQVIDEIPLEAHDQKVDMVVTSRGTFRK